MKPARPRGKLTVPLEDRLARRLLAAALREGTRRGSGTFLKLSVYHDNPTARASYDRLGFTAQSGETNMVLTGHALDNLMEAEKARKARERDLLIEVAEKTVVALQTDGDVTVVEERESVAVYDAAIAALRNRPA